MRLYRSLGIGLALVAAAGLIIATSLSETSLLRVDVLTTFTDPPLIKALLAGLAVLSIAAAVVPLVWRDLTGLTRAGLAWCLRLKRDMAMDFKQRSGPLVRRQSGYGPVWA